MQSMQNFVKGRCIRRGHLLVGLIMLLAVMNSCEEDPLTFTIEDEADFTIEATGPIDFPTPEVTTNSSREFEQNDTRADLVKEVKLKQLDLTITAPEDRNFNFLKEITIYISTENAEEIKLAWRKSIPADTQHISLKTTDKALDKYVKADNYELRFETTTDEIFGDDVDIHADIVYQVTADPV